MHASEKESMRAATRERCKRIAVRDGVKEGTNSGSPLRLETTMPQPPVVPIPPQRREPPSLPRWNLAGKTAYLWR